MRAHERPRVVVPPDSSPPPAALARGHAPPPLQPLLLLPCHLSHSLPWGHLGARGCHGSGQTRLRRRGGGDLSEIKGCPSAAASPCPRARAAGFPSFSSRRPPRPACRARRPGCNSGLRQQCAPDLHCTRAPCRARRPLLLQYVAAWAGACALSSPLLHRMLSLTRVPHGFLRVLCAAAAASALYVPRRPYSSPYHPYRSFLTAPD